MAPGMLIPLGGILLVAVVLGVAFSLLGTDGTGNGCALGLLVTGAVLLVPFLLFVVPSLL
ncbi:hypothetical protein F0L17_02255 [Streptomyces sp. TRM43335]|uniref:Uncharacterized protein n=1 Tax=Streptomyces taklimakanensis TaxID=2569853 RepID=A0A6G2B7T8_9ACTN|nr:hypothetical protein [Streptomyces taklimakanensis]MTE17972.1 hypothetical protein [Streptomyces taklimakanensis]